MVGFIEGIALTEKELLPTLERRGIEKIDPMGENSTRSSTRRCSSPDRRRGERHRASGGTGWRDPRPPAATGESGYR